ncbi:MAG: hypothetical protein LBS40_04510 [Burkholderiales bacterium]|nr:hypothetical protein [Burkholderiales bacterium]
MGFVSGDGCNPCADAPDCLLDCLNPINWLGGGKKPNLKPKNPPKQPKRKPPERPPGDCTPGKHAAMQAAVNGACKSEKGKKCKMGADRATLQAKFAKYSGCAAARKALNNTCFRGGNPGHRGGTGYIRCDGCRMRCLYEY